MKVEKQYQRSNIYGVIIVLKWILCGEEDIEEENVIHQF